MKEKKRETSFCVLDPLGHEKMMIKKQVANVANAVIFEKLAPARGYWGSVDNERENHGQSVRSVRCENGWEVHSIGDVCSMKEKITALVTIG